MGDRFAARFLIPGGLWLLAFFAVPLGIVVAISFGTTDDLGAAIYGWYPENYSRAFDPLFAPVLLRSVGYAMATVVLCLLLGYPVAYYIARFGGRHKNVLIALVVLPSSSIPLCAPTLGAIRPTSGSSTACSTRRRARRARDLLNNPVAVSAALLRLPAS